MTGSTRSLAPGRRPLAVGTLFLAIILMASVLSACGGDNEDPTPRPTRDRDGTTQQESSPEPTRVAPDEGPASTATPVPTVAATSQAAGEELQTPTPVPSTPSPPEPSPTAVQAAPTVPPAPPGPVDMGAEAGVNPKFTSISVGTSHACGVKTDGAPYCWGYNESGRATPPSGLSLESVTAGNIQSCGLKSDGTAVCWGQLENKELPSP